MVRGRTPDLCWRLMDAQHWASPRLARRQRIFLVADFGGRRSHEILFKPRTMQSLSASGRDSGLPTACVDVQGDRDYIYGISRTLETMGRLLLREQSRLPGTVNLLGCNAVDWHGDTLAGVEKLAEALMQAIAWDLKGD